MPLLPVLAAAPDRGHDVDAAALEPQRKIGAIARIGDDPVAAVGRSGTRIGPVERETAARGDEHGHPVPSFEVPNICVVSYALTSNGMAGGWNALLRPLARSR
jgi:hypothetical protein